MECVACGAETAQMEHLTLSAQSRDEFNLRFPGVDLDDQLGRFGVCAACLLLTERQRTALFSVAYQRILMKL